MVYLHKKKPPGTTHLPALSAPPLLPYPTTNNLSKFPVSAIFILSAHIWFTHKHVCFYGSKECGMIVAWTIWGKLGTDRLEPIKLSLLPAIYLPLVVSISCLLMIKPDTLRIFFYIEASTEVQEITSWMIKTHNKLGAAPPPWFRLWLNCHKTLACYIVDVGVLYDCADNKISTTVFFVISSWLFPN